MENPSNLPNLTNKKTEKIKLGKNLLEEIFSHARQDYPREACGFVVVSPDGKRAVRRCENLQDRYHAIDPETFPRTAKTAYNLDPREFTWVEEEGKRVEVLYHSHCDRGAYFSVEDRLAALFDGEPLYPEVYYIVVSVRQGQVSDVASFAWDPETQDFQTVEVQGYPGI